MVSTAYIANAMKWVVIAITLTATLLSTLRDLLMMLNATNNTATVKIQIMLSIIDSQNETSGLLPISAVKIIGKKKFKAPNP
jgi:hypothetical protein